MSRLEGQQGEVLQTQKALFSTRAFPELCLWTCFTTASAPAEIAVPHLLWSSVPPEVKMTACEHLECS